MKVAPPSIPRAAARARALLSRHWTPRFPPREASTNRNLPLLRNSSSSSDSDRPESVSGTPDRIYLLTEKLSRASAENLRSKIAAVADELLSLPDDGDIDSVLSSSSAPSFLRHSADAAPFLELLFLLSGRPLLALKIFDRRRKKLLGIRAPMISEEYVKAIKLAGKVKDSNLALELFAAAGAAGLRNSSAYNALMGAYMCTESAKKCLSLFEDMKKDPNCAPTIVTYNILLSVFGRSMLVDHMEAILTAIEESNLKPTLKTYNTAIAGYVTAWMWEKMESTFEEIENSGLKPDTLTHLLMLRGYALQGNLEKMEEMYVLEREKIHDQSPPLLRAMICAYCKSSDPDRVKRIEEISKRLPENQYRPWLNVLLIKFYARERLMDKMEGLIKEAFDRGTVIATTGVMRAIITSYFLIDDLDHLRNFVRMAESAGWRLCRSLYHCEMVMYGQKRRFREMKEVIGEMEASRFDPTKKTFLIMYKAYSNFGKKFAAQSVFGLMWKNGFILPGDAFSHP